MSNKSKCFPSKFCERAAHMVLQEEKNHPLCWSALMMITPKLDIYPDTLLKWRRLHERANVTAVHDLPDREKTRRLERENRQLWQANEILLFCLDGSRPLFQVMTRFIDEHRQAYDIGSICKVLPSVPSVYYAYQDRQKNPSAWRTKDRSLCDEIRRVWKDSFYVYEVRKAWYQLRREGMDVACMIVG